ncbi:MAG: hypothetical protein JO069_12755 [Verrucomicrobia bacterium]|nr:hypothetical protein [Verrucomicrobiota bacterium]
MQSLITLLLQLSGKAWTVIVVTVLCGGAVTVIYFSSANAGSHSTPGTPTNPIVVVQTGHAGDFGHGLGGGQRHVPLPVVPEANAGLVLIPVVAAMLFFGSRRLWTARRGLAYGSQNAEGTAEP